MVEDIIAQKIDTLLKSSLKTSGYYIKKLDDDYSRDINVGFLSDYARVSKFVDEIEFSDVIRPDVSKRLKDSCVDRNVDAVLFANGCS